MRTRLGAAALALAVVPGALAAVPFKAKLTAPTHTPTVNKLWYYTVRVTNVKGQPIKARITVQIKDPLGQVHPVQFCHNTRNIVNHPFVGTFRDCVTWPPDSAVGVTLVFQTIVKTTKGRTVLRYPVTPHR